MIDERRTKEPRRRATPAGSPSPAAGRLGRPGRVGRPAAGSRRPPAVVAGRADRPGTRSTTALAPTGAIYRLLLLRGLSESEAANLTAFLSGLPIGERPWQLREVNQLLFLRELHRRRRFGRGDVVPGLDEVPPPMA